MGNHAKQSVARTRLSTLAVTTSLAAVGVGVVGTGVANAATPGNGFAAANLAVNAPTAAVNATPTAANSLVAQADLSGTTVDLTSKPSGTLDWGDGTAAVSISFDPATGKANNPSNHSYAKAGTYTVTLNVDDGLGNLGSKPSATSKVTVGNPSAPSGFSAGSIGFSYGVGANTLDVIPTLTGATFGGKPTATSTATLDFGDGSSPVALTVDAATGAISLPATTHTYPSAKTYTITVTLDSGVPADPVLQATKAVSPSTPPFQAKLGVTQAPSTLTVTADFGGSTLDMKDLAATTGTVDWGDGSKTEAVPISNAGKFGQLQHTYAAAGPQTITYTLTDTNAPAGGTVSTAVKKITVAVPGAPAGSFTVTAGNAAKSAVADLTGISFDPISTAANHSYIVDWGDGNVQTFNGPQTAVPHTYANAGTYTVDVKANDGRGAANSQTDFGTQSVVVTGTTSGTTKVLRAAGADRIDTGVIVSRHHWADKGAATGAKASAVVLATSDNFPDALAGVPFSKKINGALLLTPGAALNGEVSTEIQRILPADASHPIYVLGGTSAVSPAVVSALQNLGYTVNRISGANRYDTALQIAHAMGDPAKVVVARGDDFADALTAGPYAADAFGGSGGAAIVLSANKTLDANTAAYVHSRLSNSTVNVVAIGGGAAAAVGSVSGAAIRTTTNPTGNVSAAIGATRYETAAMVAQAFPATSPVGLATGLKFPDALTGGAYMAAVNGPLLLTPVDAVAPGTQTAINQFAATTPEVSIFGGLAAVSQAVANSVTASVHGVQASF